MNFEHTAKDFMRDFDSTTLRKLVAKHDPCAVWEKNQTWCLLMFQLLIFLLNLLEGIDGWSMHILETLSFQGSPSCWERLGDFSQCHQNVDLKFFRPARKQNIERSYHFILRQQVTVNQTCHVAEFTKFIGACTTSLKTLLVALGKVVDNLMSFCGNPEMPTTRQHCQLGHSTTLPTWTFDPCLKNWTPTCLKLGTLRWLWSMPIVRGRKNQEIEPLPVWNLLRWFWGMPIVRGRKSQTLASCQPEKRKLGHKSTHCSLTDLMQWGRPPPKSNMVATKT